MPIRYVQIGAIGGACINLPSAVLRSSALQLMGSGIGSVPLPTLLEAIRAVLQAAPTAGFEVELERTPLASVTQAWSRESGRRIVLIP